MKENKKPVGRPKNPLWNSVINLGMFKNKTNAEIRDWLETKGFKTHIVNVYQMRKRLADKGKEVDCPRVAKKPRKVATESVSA